MSSSKLRFQIRRALFSLIKVVSAWQAILKLHEDLKFSEKVRISVPIEWRSKKTIDRSVFTVFKDIPALPTSQVYRKIQNAY